MDMKTRIAEFWQAACKKVGGFFNKIADFFKDLPNRFSGKKNSDSAETEVQDQPVSETTPEASESGFRKTCKVFKTIGVWVYRLRRIIMAIPVICCSLWLASYSTQNLPEQVGLNLQATGEFATVVDRSVAVYLPLGITGACLALMFFSRRARYPWIISVFTLVLPFLILITNLYPQ